MKLKKVNLKPISQSLWQALRIKNDLKTKNKIQSRLFYLCLFGIICLALMTGFFVVEKENLLLQLKR